jgi:hypothetical protein
MSYEQVEEAWQLSDDARSFARASGRELTPAEFWDDFFKGLALVDVALTEQQGGNPPTRIFLRSPYGLSWRPDHRDWIPFRHGPVTLDLD